MVPVGTSTAFAQSRCLLTKPDSLRLWLLQSLGGRATPLGLPEQHAEAASKAQLVLGAALPPRPPHQLLNAEPRYCRIMQFCWIITCEWALRPAESHQAKWQYGACMAPQLTYAKLCCVSSDATWAVACASLQTCQFACLLVTLCQHVLWAEQVWSAMAWIHRGRASTGNVVTARKSSPGGPQGQCPPMHILQRKAPHILPSLQVQVPCTTSCVDLSHILPIQGCVLRAL